MLASSGLLSFDFTFFALMSLTPEAIERYRHLYRQRFGVVLSWEEAHDQAERFLTVMRLVLRDWQDRSLPNQAFGLAKTPPKRLSIS